MLWAAPDQAIMGVCLSKQRPSLRALSRIILFVDGNERVAFARTAVFLKLNWFRLEVEMQQGKRFIEVDIIQKKISYLI